MSEIFEGLAGRLGLRVKLSKNLTVPGPLKSVNRHWKERLFTWPWRPWFATKMIPTQIPDPMVYKIKVPVMVGVDYAKGFGIGIGYNPYESPAPRIEEIIMAHPETWRKAEGILKRLP